MLDVLEKDGARLAADLVQSLGKFYDATGSLRYLSLPRDSITIDGVNYTKDICRHAWCISCLRWEITEGQ